MTKYQQIVIYLDEFIPNFMILTLNNVLLISKPADWQDKNFWTKKKNQLNCAQSLWASNQGKLWLRNMCQ